jgi:hypothetical protein
LTIESRHLGLHDIRNAGIHGDTHGKNYFAPADPGVEENGREENDQSM